MLPNREYQSVSSEFWSVGNMTFLDFNLSVFVLRSG